MNKEPVDYNNPLGISKKEWTRVLGVNLALLLIVYTIALICTLCGSDFFLLTTQNDSLQRMEDLMRSWNVYPLVQIGFATIEEAIILCFITLKKPKWWWIASYFGLRVINNVIWFNATGSVPAWSSTIINFGFAFAFVVSYKKKMLLPFVRFLIAVVVTLALNGLITLFRTKIGELYHIYTNIQFFYLSLEYDTALCLVLGLLALVIPWHGRKGVPAWETTSVAGGSSPTLKTKPRTNLPTNNELTDAQKRKIRKLKARVFVVQSLALVFVFSFPIFVGKPVEFSLAYVSFCLTRLVLGFNRSLHFKSELACIVTATFVFWIITLLVPNVETSIIVSLAYGLGTALGFRLYWELHDLMMYKRASKTDRYAMLYVVFKGNLDDRHIKGVMRLKGYTDDEEITMVQMYMHKDKIEYIAEKMSYAKITIEKWLTDIATDLYAKR